MGESSSSIRDGIRLISNPTVDLIVTLWEARLSNPEEVKYAFADVSLNLEQFVESLEKQKIRCVLTANNENDLIAASWLHDLERDHEGHDRIGWLGGYVFPSHRGAEAVHASRLMLNHYHDCGIHHIHTAINIDNRKSQVFMRAKGMMAFTVVCVYPDWTMFNGVFKDAVIMTRHKTDKMLAWLCASQLASKRLLLEGLRV